MNRLSPFLKKLNKIIVIDNEIKFTKLIKNVNKWPVIDYTDENNIKRKQTLDNENLEVINITNDELTILTGGDWQDQYFVKIKLINDNLEVTDYRKSNKNDKKNLINIKDMKNKLGIQKEKIAETTFELNSDDPSIQRKAQAIKDNPAIFDKENDTISIANESTYTKSEILEIMGKKLKKNNKVDDYMKGIKKADRELDYELNGPGWKANDKVHKNRKKYDRTRNKNIEITESVFTKEDINKMILEKKYNGKLYSKAELIEILNKEK